MKILFITKLYPTTELPASGTFVQEHAKSAQLYHDVIVLHCAGKDSTQVAPWRMLRECDREITAGIPTYRIWERESSSRISAFMIRVSALWHAIQTISSQDSSPDMIHFQSYSVGAASTIVGWLYGIPLVATEHSSEFYRLPLSKLHRLGALLAFKGAQTVMPVSASLRLAIEENYRIQANFRVVPNAVDIALFQPTPIPDRSEYFHKRILFVGTLDKSHKKGMPYLLDALGELNCRRQDWLLDIVGDGPSRTQYQKKVADLGIADKVVFYGMIPKPQVAHLMRRSHFLVSASVYETFGVALVESLASGRPVIATDCGGPSEFVTADVGALVSPQDSKALAQAIDTMLDEHVCYDPMALSNYARDRFSLEAVGQILNTVYRAAQRTHIGTQL